jgi:hypothetical protein
VKLPFGQTWTVLRRSAIDRTGDSDSGFQVHHTIPGCAFAPTGSESEEFGRETETSTADLYVPVGADVLASDQMESPSGDVYAVRGKPQWDQQHPMTGWKPGLKVVKLRGVT